MDINDVLRSGATNLTESDDPETLPDFPIRPMKRPLYMHVIVPTVETDDKLDVYAYFNDINDNTLQKIDMPSILEAGDYVMPFFVDHPELDHLSVILDLVMTSESPNFGGVKVYLSNSRM